VQVARREGRWEGIGTLLLARASEENLLYEVDRGTELWTAFLERAVRAART
jgi:hypothetical protein